MGHDVVLVEEQQVRGAEICHKQVLVIRQEWVLGVILAVPAEPSGGATGQIMLQP